MFKLMPAFSTRKQSKPYVRNQKEDSMSPPSPPVDCSQESNSPSSPHRLLFLGCPSYSRYKRAELSYLQSLTPRRRAKALISQETFHKIWFVLRNPSTTEYTSQFRFWVRKMFTFGEPPEIVPGLPFHNDDNASNEVILRDGLPVAIEEHMYDILCYCHELSGHGGRDKTCAVVRRFYSWVPKELVARFVRQCPTCTAKKCGGEIHPSPASESLEWSNGEGSNPLADLHGKLRLLAEGRMPNDDCGGGDSPEDWNMRRSSSGQDSPPGSENMVESLSQASTTAVESFPQRSHSLPMPRFQVSAGINSSIPIRHRIPRPCFGPGLVVPHNSSSHAMSRFTSNASSTASTSSAPMSREVSLYGGLPNGWQYFSDFSDAYDRFLVNKSRNSPVEAERLARGEMPVVHPRIPSIAPLRTEILIPIKDEDMDDVVLPPIEKTPGSDSELPPPLRSLRVLKPTQPYVPQIDPSLCEPTIMHPKTASTTLESAPGSRTIEKSTPNSGISVVTSHEEPSSL